MASYEIEWKSAAERELRNIEPKDIKRVIKAVESLADNPYPPRHRKLRGATFILIESEVSTARPSC